MRTRLLLPLLIAFASIAAASANAVYKWKDANGNLHFSDTPPPANATLISGPGAAPAQAQSLPPFECRPDISAKECEVVRAALQRDAEDLAASMPPDDPAAREEAERKAAEKVAEMRAHECVELRQMKAALQRMQSGPRGEIISDEERASLPAQIVDVDAKLAAGNCQ
ncbi:MAG: DUF4124 domain-containing protein [Proteobacteria bacterium]|nr:DUF4124 domain-containing protein [Pseudomonadota bacterium]